MTRTFSIQIVPGTVDLSFSAYLYAHDWSGKHKRTRQLGSTRVRSEADLLAWARASFGLILEQSAEQRAQWAPAAGDQDVPAAGAAQATT